MMTKDIINLIMNNSDLPIYAYVNGEVVADDQAPCSWLGKVKSAEIKNIAFVEPYGYYDQTVVDKDDTEDYEEYIANQLCDVIPMNISDDQFNKIVKSKVDELDFEKVILLNIDTI